MWHHSQREITCRPVITRDDAGKKGLICMKRIKTRHRLFILSLFFLLWTQFFVYFKTLKLYYAHYHLIISHYIKYKGLNSVFGLSLHKFYAQTLHLGWLKVIPFSQARKTSKPQEASDSQSPQTQNYQLSDLVPAMSPLPCFFVYFQMIILAGWKGEDGDCQHGGGWTGRGQKNSYIHSSDADVAIPTNQRVGRKEASGL